MTRIFYDTVGALNVCCWQQQTLTQPRYLNGSRLEAAKDGAEALECARVHAYDLILMDVQMPNLDGLSATRAIRQLPGHERTPILGITANAFIEDKEQCTRAGMNGHISKPLTLASLARILGHWLAEFSEPDANAAA